MEELMSKRGWNIGGYIYSYIYIFWMKVMRMKENRLIKWIV